MIDGAKSRLMVRNDRRIGKFAQFIGRDFEKHVQSILNAAKRNGWISFWEHTQAQYSCVGPGKFLPVSAGLPDFVGQFHGGRAFLAECKTTSGAIFRKGSITEKQQHNLTQCANGGGVALLLLEFRSEVSPCPGMVNTVRYRFAIPWANVPWVKARSAEGVKVEHLGEYAMDASFLSAYVRR